MLRVYRALLLTELQIAMQYRVQMLLWLLGNLARPVVFLAAWVAVARAQGSIGGLTAGDFAAYYLVLTLVGQLTNCWDSYEFEQDVRTGRLSSRLLRPLQPIHYSLASNLIWKLFTLPALLPVLAFLGWAFAARLALQPWQVAVFVPSVLLAAALRFLFGWLVACSAFWTTRISAINTLLDRASFVFAGQVAPLALLPGLVQTLAYALPFGYMLGVPAAILSGQVPVGQAGRLLAAQAGWVGLTYVAFQLCWRLGLRQYSAVGT